MNYREIICKYITQYYPSNKYLEFDEFMKKYNQFIRNNRKIETVKLILIHPDKYEYLYFHYFHNERTYHTYFCLSDELRLEEYLSDIELMFYYSNNILVYYSCSLRHDKYYRYKNGKFISISNKNVRIDKK